MNEFIQDLIKQIDELKEKLIVTSNIPNSVNSGFEFPEYPYNHQIFCLTTETPPEGGTLYRYDSKVKSWLKLII